MPPKRQSVPRHELRSHHSFPHQQGESYPLRGEEAPNLLSHPKICQGAVSLFHLPSFSGLVFLKEGLSSPYNRCQDPAFKC